MATSKAAKKPRAVQGAATRRAHGAAAKPPQLQRARPAAPAAPAEATAAAATADGKPNRAPTAFEERLYRVCKCIPAGRVATYGVLAEVLHSAPRACGQALRRNPFAPAVPCHRVIAASLELGGFKGSWGATCSNVAQKRQLLAEEGVQFDDGGRLLPASRPCVMTAGELHEAAAGVLKLPT